MLKKYLIVAFLFSTLIVSAQDNSIQQVTETIENYFYGYVERDIIKLNKAFDTINGTMKAPGGNKDGSEAYKNLYFKDVIPKWGNRKKLTSEELKNCSLTILSIDIYDGKMATGKISMSVGNTTYIDMLSLQKLDNHWKITNKMFLSYKND